MHVIRLNSPWILPERGGNGVCPHTHLSHILLSTEENLVSSLWEEVSWKPNG